MTLRRILLLLALVGITILIFSSLGLFGQFINVLHRVHWYIVPLIILAQLLSYYAVMNYYDAFFRLSNHHVLKRHLAEVALAVNFTNQVVPGSGVATASYMSKALSGIVPPGKCTLAQIGRYVFFVGATIPLLLIAMLIVFFSGTITHISARLLLLIVTLVIVTGIALISFFSERSRMRRVVGPVIRAYNRTGLFFFRHRFTPLTAVEVGEFFDEFYSGYRDVMRKKRSWIVLSMWALLFNIAEILTVYVAFISFGVWPNMGIVILGYQVAIAASLIGPLTAGAGALEFGMIAAFTALGLSFTLSFAVVMAYRFISMGIFLPPGFYFYRRGLK
jgi:uncharacterized protein (TIRG00374 family)